MHIRPPQPGDFSDMATLAHKALFDDPFSEYVAPYRHQNPECMRQGYLRRAKRRFYGGKYMLVAVTDQQDPDWNGTERVVGYLSANSTQRQTDRARQSWFSWNNFELAAVSLESFIINAVGADRALSYRNYNAFQRTLANLDSTGPFAKLDVHNCWDVDFLAVDPAFHRRRIGAALMKHVISLAEEERIPITILASSMGFQLYRKLGFVEVGEMKADSLHLGTAMIWYPKGSIEPGEKEPDASTGVSLETPVPPMI